MLSTGPKSLKVLKNTSVTTEQNKSLAKVFRIFETCLIQNLKKWFEQLEFPSMQQYEDSIKKDLNELKTKTENVTSA